MGSGDGLKAQHEESAGPTRETRVARRFWTLKEPARRFKYRQAIQDSCLEDII